MGKAFVNPWADFTDALPTLTGLLRDHGGQGSVMVKYYQDGLEVNRLLSDFSLPIIAKELSGLDSWEVWKGSESNVIFQQTPKYEADKADKRGGKQ